LSLRQALDDWNRKGEVPAMKELERRLVIAIRTWRPDIIVGDSPDPGTSPDPASALVSQALERAFLSAAEKNAFPELVESAGLAPWSAQKLFAPAGDNMAAGIRIDATEPGRSGNPLEDHSTLATALLAESFVASTSEARYRRVATRMRTDQVEDQLMSGIVLEPGGLAAHALCSTPRRGGQMVAGPGSRSGGEPALSARAHALSTRPLDRLPRTAREACRGLPGPSSFS
jgi:hypothetical protein